MTNDHAANSTNYQTSDARDVSDTIVAVTDACIRFAMNWLKNATPNANERGLIELHLKMLSAHSTATNTWGGQQPNVENSHPLGVTELFSDVSASDSLDGWLRNRPSISAEQTALHPALSKLHASYRENVSWSGKKGPNSDDELAFRIFQLPATEPDPITDTFIMAVDSSLVGASEATKTQEDLIEHWSTCLNYIRPWQDEVHKIGAVIWDHLDVSLSPEWVDWTAHCLGLANIDHATARACHAALFGSFVTGANAPLEPIMRALATFIHAHPLFGTTVSDAVWHLPYGDKTLYKVGRAKRQKPKQMNKRSRKNRLKVRP